MFTNGTLKLDTLIRKCLITLSLTFSVSFLYCQTILGSQGYKVIYLGTNAHGDYTRSVILLHEIYDATLLQFNNANGTITAFRGNAAAYNRSSSVTINTSSAYNATFGAMQSVSSDLPWKLKTCMYNGKKYLAVDVPYVDSFYNIGFQFAGWSNSTGETMKIVDYMANGQLINQDLISDIQDFKSNMSENHDVSQMNILGNVNIGTDISSVGYQLQVKGKIRSQEVRVETSNWPDYVFDDTYKLKPLTELQRYIKANKHLPGIPSASEMADSGISLGEMNKILLQKIEELTLHLFEQERVNTQQTEMLMKLAKTLSKHKNKQLNKKQSPFKY